MEMNHSSGGSLDYQMEQSLVKHEYERTTLNASEKSADFLLSALALDYNL